MTAVLKRDREKVRWGILSTGRITHRFVQDFAFVPNGEVVAVASRSQESADAFAARYGIARAYEGYPRLLDDPQVDAVYVATPHTIDANRDILHGRQQNAIMPWSATVRFQGHMDRVRQLYSER